MFVEHSAPPAASEVVNTDEEDVDEKDATGQQHLFSHGEKTPVSQHGLVRVDLFQLPKNELFPAQRQVANSAPVCLRTTAGRFACPHCAFSFSPPSLETGQDNSFACGLECFQLAQKWHHSADTCTFQLRLYQIAHGVLFSGTSSQDIKLCNYFLGGA